MLITSHFLYFYVLKNLNRHIFAPNTQNKFTIIMKNNFVIKAIRTIQLIAFVLIPSIMFAPPIPPNPGSSSAVTPIDGGVVFLFIAGISFGIYQIFQLRKKQLI